MAVDDSYTKSLLHLDGADGSTTITDESGKSWDAHGEAQLDTDSTHPPKFGTASLLLDGIGDYVETVANADFNFGTGNFTIDFWIRFNSVTRVFVVGQRDSPQTQWAIYYGYGIDNKVGFCWCVGGAYMGYYDTASAITTPTVDQWYHWAIVRNGTVGLLFIDGQSIALTEQNAFSTNDAGTYTANLQLGIWDTTSVPLNGWIDEFRISKGIARWTANFTPPYYPYAYGSTTNYLKKYRRLGFQ